MLLLVLYVITVIWVYYIKQMTLFKQELQEYRIAWKNNPNLESNPQEVCPLICSVSLNSASAQ